MIAMLSFELLLAYVPYFEHEPISRPVLLEAAVQRARLRVRTPDAIRVATGLICVRRRLSPTMKLARSPRVQTLILSDLAQQHYS
jgi:hypothetical protein